MREVYNPRILGLELYNYMKKNGLTYTDVSEATGVSRSSICRLINRKSYMNTKNAEKLANLLGCTLSNYSVNYCSPLASLSIEELDTLAKEVIEVRNRKIQEKLDKFKAEEENLNSMLNKGEKELWENIV